MKKFRPVTDPKSPSSSSQNIANLTTSSWFYIYRYFSIVRPCTNLNTRSRTSNIKFRTWNLLMWLKHVNEDSNYVQKLCSILEHGFNSRRYRKPTYWQEYEVLLYFFFCSWNVVSSGLCCLINWINLSIFFFSAFPHFCVLPLWNFVVSFGDCFYLFLKSVHTDSYFVL
jgi:hypothetical protein